MEKKRNRSQVNSLTFSLDLEEKADLSVFPFLFSLWKRKGGEGHSGLQNVPTRMGQKAKLRMNALQPSRHCYLKPSKYNHTAKPEQGNFNQNLAPLKAVVGKAPKAASVCSNQGKQKDFFFFPIPNFPSIKQRTRLCRLLFRPSHDSFKTSAKIFQSSSGKDLRTTNVSQLLDESLFWVI